MTGASCNSIELLTNCVQSNIVRRKWLILKLLVFAVTVSLTVTFLTYFDKDISLLNINQITDNHNPDPDPDHLINELGIEYEEMTHKGTERGIIYLRKPEDKNHEELLSFISNKTFEEYGEWGRPVVMDVQNMSAAMKKMYDDGWERNAFNQLASDLMSAHRKLPDIRDPWCKKPGRYLQNLPQTSVIICFHNEAWSTLTRSIHSVLDRSPSHLVKEIVLVDDASTMVHLSTQLREYWTDTKVRIIRLISRQGLIRARMIGTLKSVAPALTFLDSHIECTEGWLEPMLDLIARDYKNVVSPVIDVIDDETMEYHHKPSSEINVGGFDFGLQFNWHMIPPREKKRRKHDAEPVRTPTIAGGLFSISRKYFMKLGMYDPGFRIWGAENLELSFKVWMCLDGTLLIAPCSHVGHIFRKRSPYEWDKQKNVLKWNSARLAKVWMDELGGYYFQRAGGDNGDYGDITSRIKLRKSLGCKPFKWYVQNIYPELFIPGDAVASGEIANIMTDLCVDSACKPEDMHKPVGLWPCHKQGGNQYWMLSKEGEIRRDDTCLDYAGGDSVTLYNCHGSKGNQHWNYDVKTKQIRHVITNKCLGVTEDRSKLTMDRCDKRLKRQQWIFENYDPSKAH